MKVETAQVALTSQQQAVSQHRVQEQLRLWQGNTQLDMVRVQHSAQSTSVVARLSVAAQALADAMSAPAEPSATNVASPASTDAPNDDWDPKLAPLIRLIEHITGRKVRSFRAEDLQAPAASQRPAPTPPRQGWGMRYDRTEFHHEAQRTQVQAEGVVTTSDGRQIRFALSVTMQREHLQTSTVSVRAGDAQLKDPLVIHFDGLAGTLSDLRFDFDLDADGQAENMAFVGTGSGFLVLDRNGNGTVDDGRELFGALSGDGFADLAALDDDGNGWIDENDSAFEQLQVWQKDAQGNDRLRTLRDANVGALYLGRVASPFSVRDANNQTLAEVRSTGVYLRDDGVAGALQHIDLAI